MPLNDGDHKSLCLKEIPILKTFSIDMMMIRWLPLSDERNIQREWGLSVPKDRQTIGFKDIIADEYGISGL
ncbi:DUF3916 domain-containing protein [Bacillus pumilus]